MGRRTWQGLNPDDDLGCRALSHARLSHGKEVPTPAATLKLPTRPFGIRSVRVPATGAGICTLSIQKALNTGLITTLRVLEPKRWAQWKDPWAPTPQNLGSVKRTIFHTLAGTRAPSRMADQGPSPLLPALVHPGRGCRVTAESRMLCNLCRPCFTQLSANWAASFRSLRDMSFLLGRPAPGPLGTGPRALSRPANWV